MVFRDVFFRLLLVGDKVVLKFRMFIIWDLDF